MGMLVANINVNVTHSDLFQHQPFGACKYNDKAISLHFNDRAKVNERVCLTECLQSMVSQNKGNAFVDLHYSKNVKREKL